MRYENKIKEMRETMLEVVPYLSLNKVKDTEEKLINKYPDVSEHFYSDFEKTLSNENELKYFIENLNPDDSNYDNMVILNRLRLGLNTDIADEIFEKAVAFLEWIDLCAQDAQFLDSEHYRDLMDIHFKYERYQMAIKSAEKYISLETDVKLQIHGRMVILQSYYHLTGNLRMIDVIPIEETLFLQFASKGIEQADEILNILTLEPFNSNTECEEYKNIAHICRCKIANILRTIDANNDKANSIIDEYRNGKCNTLKNKIINAIRFGIIRGDEYPEIERYLPDFSDFFEEVTKNCREENKEDYIKILCKSLRILEYLHVKSEEELPLSYYTSKDISEKILFQKKQSEKEQSEKEQSPFRQYSVNTSNDPEEGKTLLHYLFPPKKISLRIEEHGAFAGCFTFNNDSLNQFRLYGKANKEEGTGISIAFNKNFFNMKSIVLPTKNSTEELSIFRCVYIDTETDTIVSLGHKEESVFLRERKKVNYQEYIDYINNILKDVKKELKDLKEQVRNWESKNLDYNVIIKLLLPLRYLIKNAAFKEEQECRIIQTKKITDPYVLEDNENNRFYVDYFKLSPDNVAKIVFGPKVKDIDKYRQCLARNGYDGIECYQSKVPLA